MKQLLKIGSLFLLSAIVAGVPRQLMAQTTNKPAAKHTSEKAPPASAEKKAHPFHGKLAEVNKVAKTITVGKSVYQITSETKIKKGDKPATLEDGVVGEQVSGYVKPNAEGKMAATTVTFGPKPEAKADSKSSAKSKEKTPASK
jgi:hypothetical protein